MAVAMEVLVMLLQSGGVDTWWKLPGSWQPPGGAVVLQTGSLGTPLAQIDFAFLSGGSPFFNNTQNVYIFSQYYPVDGPDVYLRVHPNDPTHQVETVLVSRAGADVCPLVSWRRRRCGGAAKCSTSRRSRCV